MKKPLALSLAIIMLLVLFSACGEKENIEPSASISTSVSSNTSAAPGTEIGAIVSGEGAGDISAAVDLTTVDVQPSDSETLRVAYTQESEGLTMLGFKFGATGYVSNYFYDTLLTWDCVNNVPAPLLATSWEWVDDLTFRLKLREDVTSIDGDPFTAEDVVWTWNLNHSTVTYNAYFDMFDYDKTKAVDKYTVDIALKKPYPFLITDLCHTAYQVGVQASYERIGEAEAARIDPAAGTGPYDIVKWEPGCIYMERRDNYWGIMPYYKYIEFWTVTDGSARMMGLEAGDFDVVFNPSAIQLSSAAENPNLTTWSLAMPGNATNMVLNSDREPLNIKEVRQAISLAIDRGAIVELTLFGNGVTTDSVFNSRNEAYCEPTVGLPNYYTYDAEAAKAKMVEAGYADGFTINCKYRTADSAVTQAVEMVQNMLSRINITLTLIPLESATWNTDMRNGDFDTTISTLGNPNPKRILITIDPRSTHNSATGCAGANWAPAGVDAIIDRCLNTVDDTERLAAFTELQDICREYVPLIVLACPNQNYVTSKDIVYLGVNSVGNLSAYSCYPADYLPQ